MFAYGADIGWLKQFEDMGYTWVDEDGVQKDVLDILKSMGVNALRFRVFVNPPEDARWVKSPEDIVYLGYADEKSVLEAAKRAAGKNFRVMINFHYSDYFADPGCQLMPKAWEGHSDEQLLEDVYQHTYHVLKALTDNGITPEWVQVGNEINNGMMLPAASAKEAFHKLAGLLNRGYEAVKDASPASRVVTHIADGQDKAFCREFFDRFLMEYQGKTDIIGLSFYPYIVTHYLGGDYEESIRSTAENVKALSDRYEKDIMICEIGEEAQEEEKGYCLAKAMVKALKSIPDARGLGVFWWEPESNSAMLPDGYAMGAARMSGEKTLQFTKALSAFRDNGND